LVPLVFTGGLGIASFSQIPEAATPRRLSCFWTRLPCFSSFPNFRQGKAASPQEALMSEFDFDVVSDISDLPRRRPPVAGTMPASPAPRPATEATRATGEKGSKAD
jgi:hypothetical protein